MIIESGSDIVTHVIGGYLGAGKTSFVRSVLTSTTVPVAVIVNDFGSVNIDRALLSRVGDNLVELTNGCICCSVGDSLAEAIFTVMEHPRRPEMLLIEASGVADPAGITAFTHLDGLINGGTVVLVDAVNAIGTHVNPLVTRTFERQIRAADLLAITKTDIADAQVTAKVRALLESLAPSTPVAVASPDALGSVIVTSNIATFSDVSHDDFRSRRIENMNFTDIDGLKEFLHALPSNTVRAKGVVSLTDGSNHEVHLVGNHVAVTATDLFPTGIIVIETPESPSGPDGTTTPGIE